MDRRAGSAVVLLAVSLMGSRAALCTNGGPQANSLKKPSGATAAQTSRSAAFQAAVELYTGRQYAQAVTAFQNVLQKEPRNALAGLYLANCYCGLGQIDAAKRYYQWVSSSYPDAVEGRTATQMLQRLGGNTHPAVAAPAVSTGSEHAASATTGTDGDFDTKSMIKLVRPLANHPPCSKDFIDQIADALNKFPKPLLRFMHSHGCRICLTPSLIDRNPELRNTKPRGYEQGSTYKNTPAMFDAPEVVVCQYAAIGESDDDFHPMDGFVGVMRHEFGHAVDQYMGRVSYTEKFRQVYYWDLGKMDDGAKSELSYFVQQGTLSGGPSECFAQACCIVLGGDTSSSREKQDEVFKQCFPGVIAYVKNMIKDLDK